MVMQKNSLMISFAFVGYYQVKVFILYYYPFLFRSANNFLDFYKVKLI